MTSPDHTPSGDSPGTPRRVAVVLAAGGGSRFDGHEHKLLAQLPATDTRPAERVVERSLASVATAVAAGGFDELVVVTGAADLHGAVDGIADRADVSDRTRLVHNVRWAEGQATSLHVGVLAADEAGAEIVVVGLADQPDVRTDTWVRVVETAVRTPERPITVATYDGRPRNPVALRRSIWPQLPTDGDGGARELIRLRPGLVTEVPSSGSAADIDTVEDLRRWQNT